LGEDAENVAEERLGVKDFFPHNSPRKIPDAEVERRATADPDADAISAGFWDNAKVLVPETKQQITLRLAPAVVRFFKATGKAYNSRMGEVLRSYVAAKSKRG